MTCLGGKLSNVFAARGTPAVAKHMPRHTLSRAGSSNLKAAVVIRTRTMVQTL